MVQTEQPLKETKLKKADDVSMLFDAVKELTKEVGQLKSEVTKLVEEWGKWRKAGKF